VHHAGNQFFNASAANALQRYPADSGFGRHLLVPHRIQDLADLAAFAPERFGHRAETVDELPLQTTGGLG
jgi:hypothetical protein